MPLMPQPPHRHPPARATVTERGHANSTCIHSIPFQVAGGGLFLRLLPRYHPRGGRSLHGLVAYHCIARTDATALQGLGWLVSNS